MQSINIPGTRPKYTAWAETAIKMIEDEQVDKLLSVEPSAGKRKTPGRPCKSSALYSQQPRQNNLQKVQRQGVFVGSGAIESGNKLIVQQRLKQAGMRWSVNGAQAVLSLRAKDKSNLWQSHVVQPQPPLRLARKSWRTQQFFRACVLQAEHEIFLVIHGFLTWHLALADDLSRE